MRDYEAMGAVGESLPAQTLGRDDCRQFVARENHGGVEETEAQER